MGRIPYITLPTEGLLPRLLHLVKFWMAKVLKFPLRTKTFLIYLSLVLQKLVVAALTMLIDVETFLLDSLVNTETANLLDRVEEDDTCNGRPSVDAKDTEALCAKESEATTIEGTTVDGKETCHQGTKDTTYTMYRTCTNWVVNVKLGVDELDREHENDTSQETDDE